MASGSYVRTFSKCKENLPTSSSSNCGTRCTCQLALKMYLVLGGGSQGLDVTFCNSNSFQYNCSCMYLSFVSNSFPRNSKFFQLKPALSIPLLFACLMHKFKSHEFNLTINGKLRFASGLPSYIALYHSLNLVLASTVAL